MASKAQRAVTDVPPERWAQLGEALQAWREDELGYQVRAKFADDRFINLRLVQDLEKNYRPGTFTKWALQDAAQAYKVTYESVLAFLHGEADALARARVDAGKQLAAIDPLSLPPAPFGDPDREAADRPWALAIWESFLDTPRGVADPSGGQMFPSDPDDARDWDKYADWEIGDRVWFIADLRRRADGRVPPNSGTGDTGA
jgi:hypothetical protein